MTLPEAIPQIEEDLFRWAEPLAQIAIDMSNVSTVSQAITNPPTQAEVQNIQAKLNEILNLFK